MSVPTALAAAVQSVVLVAANVQGGDKVGSGFVVASDATTSKVITANHVIDGVKSVNVYIGGPKGSKFVATILRSDPMRDIALLQIQDGNLPAFQIADAEPTRSGVSVEVWGYPTIRDAAATTPSKLGDVTFSELKLVTVAGKVDGESEEGETLLFDIAVTHGDSGAPVVDVATGRVVAMILGRASGYGMMRWISGDALGLSPAGIAGFLDPQVPVTIPNSPAFRIAIKSGQPSEIATTFADLGAAGGFIPVDTSRPEDCGAVRTNAAIEEAPWSSGGQSGVSIALTDCSGASIFQDAMTGITGEISSPAMILGRELLGFADTHRAKWRSLVRFGVAVDPARNPYLALMSVERNPFGQLVVAHVFRDGPAYLAGARPADAIVKIDGRPTRSLGDEFVARLLNQPSFTLQLIRKRNMLTVKVAARRFTDLTADGPVPR